ncbi:hypothetical protein ACN47E_008314 [Coniothyrium glycines]
MSSNSSITTPAPLSFSPSQYFDGNDGRWSSFVVRAGTPEQSFRIFPSTVTSEVFLPMAGACKDGAPDNCSFNRGAEYYNGRPNGGFQSTTSSTWHEIGIFGTSLREELGYNASALYGLDNLGLMIANSGGPTLPSQVLGAVVNPRLWVGRLGMDVKPSNFSGFENPQRSLIPTLKDEGIIPSLSYGYTAGAYYKKPSAYGSLTFGGYDQSRFVPNSISFPFDANDSRKPSLNVQAIVAQDLTNQTVNLLPDGAAYTLVDFAESQLWLPISTCDAFATAFNLTYDNATDLYTVDPSTHNQLMARNPTITFGLGQTYDPAKRVNIVLPYSAFDQQATYPIYQNATNYFPIRRAYNDTQYTLGRTFFQEAYIRIDYERGNFSVHQALFPGTNEKQQIVPITSPETSPVSEAGSAGAFLPLSTGAKAGISVGSVAFLAFLLLLLIWVTKHRKATRVEDDVEEVATPKIECADHPKLESDGAAFYEKDGKPFAEMEGHVWPELHSPQSELDDEELRISGKPLVEISERFELGDGRKSGSIRSDIADIKVASPEWTERDSSRQI